MILEALQWLHQNRCDFNRRNAKNVGTTVLGRPHLQEAHMAEQLPLKIEDTINSLFTGELQTNLLNLISYLRANKMNPSRSSAITYKIAVNGKVVGNFRIYKDTGEICITPILDVNKPAATPNKFKELIIANNTGKSCHPCHGKKCQYHLNSILGNDSTNACSQGVSFTNPTATELECIKQLLIMRRDALRSR